MVTANSLLILIRRTMAMLEGQMQHQGAVFLSDGGFRERLHQCRTEAREAVEPSPACQDCGKPMRKRKAKAGKNIGQEFWGCSGYPDCKGSPRIDPNSAILKFPSTPSPAS